MAAITYWTSPAELVIEEANWLTLPNDISKPEGGFDALICLGNSFPFVLDVKGDKSNIKLAIRNFHEMLRPNGYLIIDHRNYDAILQSGEWPADNIYYNGKNVYITTREMNTKCIRGDQYVEAFDQNDSYNPKKGKAHDKALKHFRFTHYPHQLEDFTNLLKEVFGQDSKYQVYGDYKPLGAIENPVFFIHFIQKGADNSSF